MSSDYEPPRRARRLLNGSYRPGISAGSSTIFVALAVARAGEFWLTSDRLVCTKGEIARWSTR